MKRYFTQLKTILTHPPIDRWAAYLAAVAFFVYCGFYGVYIAKGWTFTLPNWNTVLRVLVLIILVDTLKTISEVLSPREFVHAQERSGDVSVIVPSMNGAKKLPATIEGLLKRFPAKNILVVPNGCKDNTAEVARSYGVRVYNSPEPIGKVGALHKGLQHVETQYTLIIDDDTLIGDALLPISAMRQGNFEAAAFRVFPVITNWLTKIQNYEYRKSMDIGKPFHNDTATVQTVSGAIGLFKTTELRRQVKLHSGEFSGEDLQRTLLIHAAPHSNGVIISDSIVLTEPPTSIGQLFRQRVLGWTPGAFSNLRLFGKILFAAHVPWRMRVDAFYNTVLVVGLDILRAFTFPVLIFFPWLFSLMYVIYMMVECISYFSLHKADRGPFWIVLLYPLYGLFGFVTRVSGFIVFIYRRVAVKLGRLPHLDDYRKARTSVQVVTLVISFTIMAAICTSFVHIKLHGIAYARTTAAYMQRVPNPFEAAPTITIEIPGKSHAQLIDLDAHVATREQTNELNTFTPDTTPTSTSKPLTLACLQ